MWCFKGFVNKLIAGAIVHRVQTFVLKLNCVTVRQLQLKWFVTLMLVSTRWQKVETHGHSRVHRELPQHSASHSWSCIMSISFKELVVPHDDSWRLSWLKPRWGTRFSRAGWLIHWLFWRLHVSLGLLWRCLWHFPHIPCRRSLDQALWAEWSSLGAPPTHQEHTL